MAFDSQNLVNQVFGLKKDIEQYGK
jgi:hypothetical protein